MHLMVTKRRFHLIGQVTFPLPTPLSKYTLGSFPCPGLTHYGNYFGEMMAIRKYVLKKTYVHESMFLKIFMQRNCKYLQNTKN